jgi:hypothetical protein
MLTAAVPIFYAETEGRRLRAWMYALFFATGLIVGLKPMVYKEPREYSLTVLMVLAYILTAVLCALLLHPGPLRGHLGF